MELPSLLLWDHQWGEDLTYLEWIVYGISAGSLLISSLFFLLTLSKKIRYAIPANVNCWFCNENMKIPYASKNNWNCSKCHQYNGFAEDGSYNKRIPAQYIESLNKPIKAALSKVRISKTTDDSNSNGLCSECNLNQELKCFQLASFVPSSDSSFDREIETEQKRLEDVYDLCTSCKLVVKQSLQISTDTQAQVASGKNAQSKVSKSQSCLGEIFNWATGSKSILSGNPEASSVMSKSGNCFSDTETEDEDENNMKMEKLQIGSPTKGKGPVLYVQKDEDCKLAGIGKRFSNPNSVRSFNSCSTPPSVSVSPPLSLRVTPPCKFLENYHNDPPLWKDYPMVHNSSEVSGVPSCYSFSGDSQRLGCSPVSFGTTSFYNYRSSSMATVFGGRRPLISPSRLSSQPTSHIPYYPHIPPHQPCQTSFGGYGVFYGTADLIIPQQFSNPLPLSRSSSQSSGFVSQYDVNLNPTSTNLRFPAAPRSIYSHDQSLHPAVYADRIRRNANCSPTQCTEYVNNSNYGGNLSRNQSLGSSSRGFYGQININNGDTCSRLGRRGKSFEPLNESQLYSDEEDSTFNESYQTAKSSLIESKIKNRKCCNNKRNNKKRDQLNVANSPSSTNMNDTRDRKELKSKNSTTESSSISTTLTTWSKYFGLVYQVFLRVALFANILLVFCLFFVGRWPDFVEPYVNATVGCCESFTGYLDNNFPNLFFPITCRVGVVGYFDSDADIDMNDQLINQLMV